MRGASVDNQENLARFADQQPFEKLDEDIGVYPTLFLAWFKPGLHARRN